MKGCDACGRCANAAVVADDGGGWGRSGDEFLARGDERVLNREEAAVDDDVDASADAFADEGDFTNRGDAATTAVADDGDFANRGDAATAAVADDGDFANRGDAAAAAIADDGDFANRGDDAAAADDATKGEVEGSARDDDGTSWLACGGYPECAIKYAIE